MKKPESILEKLLQCLRLCKKAEREFYLSSLYQHLTEHPELMGEESGAQDMADWSGEKYVDVQAEQWNSLVNDAKEYFKPSDIKNVYKHTGKGIVGLEE